MANTDYLESLTPTLYIGVGGTGLETLKLIKSRNQEVYPPDLPIFDYLTIDTRDNEDIEPLEEAEKIALSKEGSVKNAGAVLKDIGNLHPDIARWLPEIQKWEKFKDMGEVMEGANQCRAIGRFLFHLSKLSIRDRIKKKIQNITSAHALSIVNQWQLDVAVGKDVEIFIVCSLCGGTGSGQFIDLAYMSKQTFKHMNIKVSAILGMPNLFADTPADTESQNKANAYAALKELDYYMDNKDYNMIPSFGPSLGTAPFNNVYLISSPNETGVTLRSRDEACKMISTSLFALSASKTKIAYNEYYVNDSSKLGIKAPNKQGTQFITTYSSLGVASLKFPYDSLVKACTLRRASELCKIITAKQDDSKLCENYIEQFFSEFGLKPDVLAQTLYPSIEKQIAQWRQSAEENLAGIKEHKLEGEIDIQKSELEHSRIHNTQDIIDKKKDQLLTGGKGLKNKIEIYFRGIINDYDDAGLSSAEKTISGALEDLEEFKEELSEANNAAQTEIKDSEKSYNKNYADLMNLASQSWFKDLIDFDKDEELDKLTKNSLDALQRKGKNQLFVKCINAIEEIYEGVRSILNSIAQEIANIKNLLEETKNDIDSSFRRAKKIPSRNGLEYRVLRNGDEGVDTMIKDFDLLRQSSVYEDIKKLYQRIPLSEWHTQMADKNDVGDRNQVITFLTSYIGPEIKNAFENHSIVDELNATGQFDSYIITNLITPSSPFISIDNGTLKAGGQDHIFEKDILGVEDKDNIDKRITDNVSNAIHTSTKDRNSIVLLQTKHGFPIFSVAQIAEYKNECDFKRKTGDNPCFTLNDDLISNFRDITPEARESVNVYRRAVHAFDLGRMTGFLKTKGKGSVYYFCEVRDDINSGFAIRGDGGGGRQKTKQWLMEKENRDYLEKLEQKIKSYLLNLDGESFDEFYNNWQIFKTKAANKSKKEKNWKDVETGAPDYSVNDNDPKLLSDVMEAKGKSN